MTRSIALHITGLGDSLLLLALCVLLGLWLLLTQSRRDALVWGAAVLACIACVALVKIYFIACPLTDLGIRSPSGHAAFSAVAYGGLAHCASRERLLWRVWGVRALALMLVIAIAWSRVWLRAHTVAEVLAGLAIGALALAVFVGQSRIRPASRWSVLWALPVVAMAAWLVAGRAVNFEAWFRQLGAMLHIGQGFCPL